MAFSILVLGGRVDAAAEECVGGVNVFDFAAGGHGDGVFQDHHCFPVGLRRNRARR